MPPPFAQVSASQILLTMMFIVIVLVTLRILATRKPDQEPEEIPPIVTFECESCGEDLNSDDALCPMCGGRVLRIETRPETWHAGGELRDSS